LDELLINMKDEFLMYLMLNSKYLSMLLLLTSFGTHKAETEAVDIKFGMLHLQKSKVILVV